MADIIIDVETRVNLRPLGDGLSAATAKASEFEKSINAANARVLAFGASAGLIYKLGEAFNGLVKSTIEVEKSLVDVNTLLNLNQKQIAEFGAELFNVAKGSSQSFEMVSEAAKELARQGLDSGKVLRRTADAMNLAKLSGISASSAVETLTAVLGTFNEQGLNSATIVDRLAAVDAEFAVSSEHLSDALKRSASSAVDANVSFNELIGVVTVVQERTARGGAVIGNAFKSIFTRLGRTEVLDDLANLGIAVKNTEGEILPTIQILKNLSASYAGLAPASKAFISEQVAGVYQIGTLKALMADLSSENSRFAKTQIVAANSSGSTSARINELNTSLDAYLSRLGSAGKQFGAAFGREGLLSNMKALVGGATGLLEMMTPDPKNSEAIGNKIGVGLMKGLGGFLTGPGLIAASLIGGKILMKFVSDVTQAASSLASIGKSMSQEELQRKSLEQAIAREIQRQPALLDSVRDGTMRVSVAQDQILTKLRQEAVLRQKILESAMQMAGPLGAAGVLTSDRGVMYTKPTTKARGFIPNFNYGQEIEDAGASEHGYTAGKAYKTKIHDGRGKSFESFVNDNEDVRTVTNSSGNLATFVTPPNGYGKGTTMAAGGFVPNFNFIKGRNTFQTKWIQEQMKKDGVKESDPGFNDYFKSLATKFAVKYPHDQMMMGLSGGFVPNFRNIKYHNNPEPNEKEFKMYSIGDKFVEKEGEDAKYQSYLDFSKREFKLKDGSVNKVIELEYIQGKEKGDGFAMFERLMKLSKRTKRDVVTKWLEPQSERLPELNSSQSNTSKLFKIFPQIRYRDSSKYVSDGYMNGPGDGLGFKFESIQALKSRVEKKKPAAFLESLKKNEITIKDIKTRALNKGFIPNFALDKVWSLAQTGTLPKKEGGYTEQQQAAVLGEMYESELFQKLPSFGFSDIKHLSGKNKNIEADFFARYQGSPWLLDAKRSNNDQAKLSRLAKKEATMRALFERVKLDDKALTSIDPTIAPLLADKMNMKLGVILSHVPSTTATRYKNSIKGKGLVKGYEGLDSNAPAYQNFSGGFVPNFVDVNYEKSSVSSSKKYTTPSGSYLRFYTKNPGEIDVGFIRSEKSGEGFAMFERLMKLAKRTKSDVVSSTLIGQDDEIPKLDPNLSNTSKLFKIFPQVRYRDVPSKYHTTGFMYAHDEPMGYRFSSIEDLKARVEKKPKDSFSQNLKSLDISNLRTRALSKGFVPNFANYADSVMGLEENLSGNKATFHTEPFPHVRNSSQPTFSAAMADHGGLSNALSDSMKGQKAAGLIPNFASPTEGMDLRGPTGTIVSSAKVDKAINDYIKSIKNVEVDNTKLAQGIKAAIAGLGLSKESFNQVQRAGIDYTITQRTATAAAKEQAAAARAAAAVVATANAKIKAYVDSIKGTTVSNSDIAKGIKAQIKGLGLPQESFNQVQRAGIDNAKAQRQQEDTAKYEGSVKGKFDFVTGRGRYKNIKPAADLEPEDIQKAAEEKAFNRSFKGKVSFLKGIDKEGNELQGSAATNRQLKLGAASMAMSMAGSQITQFTAGKGGALEKTGQAIEGVTNAASYAAMGAVFGPVGIIGGAVLGLGVAAYKIFGDTEEKAAKAAEKSKELSDSIGLLGSGMTSLKDNIIALAGASTEAEKVIIRQKIVQDKANVDALIGKIEKEAGKSGVGKGVAANIKTLRDARESDTGGDPDKNAEAIRQLDEYSKGLAEFKAAKADKKNPSLLPSITRTMQASGIDLDSVVEEYFQTIKELRESSQKISELASTRNAPNVNSKEFADLGEKISLERIKFQNLSKALQNSGDRARLTIKDNLGEDFADPVYFRQILEASKGIAKAKQQSALGEKKTQAKQSNIQSYIDTKRESMFAESVGAQKKSTALDFTDSAKLIGRELELSSRNALGNIDAFSKAFQETANAIKKIEEDAKRAEIGEEFKNLQEAQTDLVAEMERTKKRLSEGKEAGGEEYATDLNNIIDSKNIIQVSEKIDKLLKPLKEKERTKEGLTEAEKLRKDALQKTSDQIDKQTATAADTKQKTKNNIDTKRLELKSTERLIEDQSKYAGILSEITLSYQDLDFAIKESIKTQDERAGYALEGQRLQRDFSSERMSAMGVTLSPAAAREDAYFESSRRQVEDAQNKIDASQRKAGGNQKSFSNANLEMYSVSGDYYEPINKDNVNETITKIKKQLPKAAADQKMHLEEMLKLAQAYKADSEATQGLTNTKEGLEASIKVNKEAYDTNTRAFREETYALEINKMKVENKLAFDSSGRKIESEKYLSRFMGPDMAQGENAAAKIEQDQSLAIQDYDQAFDAKNVDLDRQIASLSIKAIQSYKSEEKDQIDKKITDLKAQQDQGKKKRELEIKKMNDTASQGQGSLKETREFDLVESQKALNRNLAKTKRQDASEIYLSQARINSENYLSRDIRSTMGEGGSAAAKIKEDTNLQIMQSRAEVALKGTDRQLQIDDLDVRRKALVGPGLDTERADLQNKIDKLTKENVADGKMQVANEEKINALMIQRLETLKESRTLSAITNSFFVDLANASDPIANLQRDVKNLAGSMQKGFEDAFVSFVDGTASAGDAFKGFVRSIAKEMAAMSARFTANLITNSLSQLGGTAFQSAQSYFGGSQGGVVRAATGGHITGGSGVRDDIPAILTGGEYVIKKGSVNKYGVDFLEKINAQKFASGGQALSNQYTLGTFSGNYAKGDSETLRGAPTPLLGGVDLNGGSFTMGQYNIDPRLSNIALSDENNPQNRIREDMAELDMERKIAFDDYSSDKRRALENFQIEKDNAAQAALINAAVQIAVAGIANKIGEMTKSAEAAKSAKDIGNASAEGSRQAYETGLATATGGTEQPLSQAQSASIARGNALIGKGVTSVDPGKFNFFSKSIEPKYNIGNTSLNSNQFNEFSKIQALQQQLGKFQEDAMQTKEANTLKGLDGGSGDASRDTVNERLAKKVIQNTKDIEAAFKKLKMQKRASGGFISDGSGTKDDVPALLMGGEYVISKPAVQKYGVDFMSRVNSGSLTGFARGGSVGDLAPLGSGGSSSTGGNEDLIESINNLSAKIQSQLDKTGGGAGGGAISNNIEININVSESGEVKGSNMSSGDKAKESGTASSEEQKQEDNKKRQELAGMLQGMITSTLVKEQRKGGLLAR